MMTKRENFNFLVERALEENAGLNGLPKHGIASTLKPLNNGGRTGTTSIPCLITPRTSVGQFTPPMLLSH